MSWPLLTIVILVVGLAGLFGLCEWAARRMHKTLNERDD